MYRFVLFAVGTIVVVAHPRSEGMPACGRIAHGGFSCCKNGFPQLSVSDDIKECFKLAKKTPSCEVEMCLAKKRGIATDDGSIDKKKLADEIEKNFENYPELVDAIKDNCVNGDLSKYGPNDMCHWMKHRICLEVQITKSCNEWNDEGDCSGIKELAEECVKQFS